MSSRCGVTAGPARARARARERRTCRSGRARTRNSAAGAMPREHGLLRRGGGLFQLARRWCRDSVTMLLMPRTSPTGTPCRCATWRPPRPPCSRPRRRCALRSLARDGIGARARRHGHELARARSTGNTCIGRSLYIGRRRVDHREARAPSCRESLPDSPRRDRRSTRCRRRRPPRRLEARSGICAAHATHHDCAAIRREIASVTACAAFTGPTPVTITWMRSWSRRWRSNAPSNSWPRRPASSRKHISGVGTISVRRSTFGTHR